MMMFTIDFVSNSLIFKDDVEFLNLAMFKFCSEVGGKDIVRRIILAALVTVAQTCLDEVQVTKEVKIADYGMIADDEGCIGAEVIGECFGEVKSRLGMVAAGERRDEVQKAFDGVDDSFMPLSHENDKRVAFRFEKVNYWNMAHYDDQKLEIVERNLKELLDILIIEAETVTNKSFDQLPYNESFVSMGTIFCQSYVNLLADRATFIARQIFISIFQNYGFEIYKKLKGIFENCFNSTNNNKHIIEVYEQEIYIAALYSASFSYSDSEFQQVVDDVFSILKKFMTPLHQKKNSLIFGRLLWALGSCSAKRLKYVLKVVNHTFDSIHNQESKNMMIIVYLAMLYLTRHCLDSETEQHIQTALQLDKIKSMRDSELFSEMYSTLHKFSFASARYSLDKLLASAEKIPKNSIFEFSSQNNESLPFMSSKQEANYCTLIENLMDFSKAQDPVLKSRILQIFTVSVHNNRFWHISNSNYNLSLKMMKAIISIDSAENEILRDSMPGLRGWIASVATFCTIAKDLQKRLADDIEEYYQELKGTDKELNFLILYSILASHDFNEQRLDFLVKVIGQAKSKLDEGCSKACSFVIAMSDEEDLNRYVDHVGEQLEKIKKM
jgi:hypothetical protein